MASLFSKLLLVFGFLKRSFESEVIKHLVKVFITNEMACHSITLTVHFVHGFAGRLIFISLIQLSQSISCILSCQVSPFRLRLSISTRIGFLLQGVTPAQVLWGTAEPSLTQLSFMLSFGFGNQHHRIFQLMLDRVSVAVPVIHIPLADSKLNVNRSAPKRTLCHTQ